MSKDALLMEAYLEAAQKRVSDLRAARLYLQRLGTSEAISQREAARRHGVTHWRVHRAVKLLLQMTREGDGERGGNAT